MLGRANWWLPGWLDRVLPRLHVEPADLRPVRFEPSPSGRLSGEAATREQV
jgi:putative drug exporter of the RND superfamily